MTRYKKSAILSLYLLFRLVGCNREEKLVSPVNFYLNSMLHDRYVLPLWTNITCVSDCVRVSQRVFLFENTFALQSSPNSNQWSLSGLDWAPTLRYLRTKVFQEILFPRVILFINIKSFVFILTSLSFLWGHCIVAIEVIWANSKRPTTFFVKPSLM